jgi:hypothetical protein
MSRHGCIVFDLRLARRHICLRHRLILVMSGRRRSIVNTAVGPICLAAVSSVAESELCSKQQRTGDEATKSVCVSICPLVSLFKSLGGSRYERRGKHA